MTDSKKLSKKRRDALDVEIREKASGYGLGWVHAHEIDDIGLSSALVLATKRAVEQVKAPYHEIIIDGTINFLAATSKGQYVTTMKKADLLVPSVSAASIIAKVARDTYMSQQEEIYPGYGFSNHVGYGTAAHRAAINSCGVTPLHRLSFAPLAKYRNDSPPTAYGQGVVVNAKTTDTTTRIGDEAEDEAANHLIQLGHEIVERNWKTKYCEIDIVSRKDEVVYFTEVKYRRQPNQGGGFAAITSKKLNQMRFAAKLFAHTHKITDTQLAVSAVALTGSPPMVEAYIESV